MTLDHGKLNDVPIDSCVLSKELEKLLREEFAEDLRVLENLEAACGLA